MILTLKLDPYVRLRKGVRSEGILFAAGLGAGVGPGVYPARLNPYGAVSVAQPDGNHFGLKPGEFEWCAPPYFVGEAAEVEGTLYKVTGVDLVMQLVDGAEWVWGSGRSELRREPIAMRVVLQREFRRICPGCGEEIDPDCCWYRTGCHDAWEGHPFVPAGCWCFSMLSADHAARSRRRRVVADAEALYPMTASAARAGDVEALELLAGKVAGERPDIDDLFAILGGWKDRP